MQYTNTTIVFCSFGQHHSWTDKSLQPGLNSYGKWFPGASFHLYTDSEERLKWWKHEAGRMDGTVVVPPFNTKAPRYGYYATNYFKVVGCLRSSTPYTLAVDSDTVVISPAVYSIYAILDRFGVALPVSDRHTVREDTRVGADSDGQLDDTGGWTQGYNMTPICYKHGHNRADKLFQTFLFYSRLHPTRGPLTMWRSIWMSGVLPCTLPGQWCVSPPQDGIKDPIILHVGKGDSIICEHYAKEIDANS